MSRSLETFMLNSSCKMNECAIVDESALCEPCKAAIANMALEALTDLQYGHAQRYEENIKFLTTMCLTKRRHFVHLMQSTFAECIIPSLRVRQGIVKYIQALLWSPANQI